MANTGPFRSIFVAFASVSLWLFPLMYLFDHIHLRPGVSHALFSNTLAVLRVATLALGTLPIFAVLWLAGEPVAAIGKAVCQIVWRLYGRAGSLYQLFDWRHAKILGDILSGFIATPVCMVLFGTASLALTFTWPMNLSLGLILLLLLVAHAVFDPDSEPSSSHDNLTLSELVSKVVRSVLLPLALGMCGVLWMQLFFNIYDANSHAVRLYENYLSYLSAKSKLWVDFSIPSTIGLAAGLLVLALIVPRLKPATRLLSLKSAMGKASAFIVCVSSFTFLSQAPFKFEDWKEARRLQAERRAEDEATNTAALQATYLIVRNLNPTDGAYYLHMFEELNDTVPYGDHGRMVEALVKSRMVVSSDTPKDKSPENMKGVDEIHSLPKLDRKDQVIEVIQDLFCSLIGAETPEIKGLAGKFIEELVDQESEQFFVRNIKPRIEGVPDQAVLDAAKERLHVLAKKEKATEDTKTEHAEMEQIRAELNAHEKELKDEDYQHEIKYRAEHPVAEEVP